MTLRVRNWERWQSYRRDRGQPPWIKVHRRLVQDEKWVVLTDKQKGQLVSMWILAADRDGALPECPKVLKKLCQLDDEPDIGAFVSLGWLSQRRQRDAKVASTSLARAETEAETESESEEKDSSAEPLSRSTPVSRAEFIRLPLAKKGEEAIITESQIVEWSEAYPGVDVRQQLRSMRQWCINNPTKRKTIRGIGKFITGWLAKQQDSPRGHVNGNGSGYSHVSKTAAMFEGIDLAVARAQANKSPSAEVGDPGGRRSPEDVPKATGSA